MNSKSFLETIRVQDGEVFNLEYHQKRYESVLDSLGISAYKNLSEFIKAPSDALYRCRLIYTSDIIEVSYHKYTKRNVSRLKIIYDDEIEYSKKSTNREEIDALFARRGRYDDVLIIKNSLLTDTSIANIALFKDGVWYTPLSPLLKGTTRARLLDEGKIVEKDIHLDELNDYTQVALMNAMIDFDIIAQENRGELFC